MPSAASTDLTSPSPSSRAVSTLFGDLDLDSALVESDTEPDVLSGPEAPTSGLGKRTRADGEEESDEETAAPATVDGNLAIFARRQAKTRRLTVDRSKAVLRFATEPNVYKLVDMYAQGEETLQAIAEFKVVQPPWVVSPDLETNLKRYTCAVLFSSKLSSYRDDTALNIVLKIAKSLNLSGLYDGIWIVPSDTDKIKAVIMEALTQFRSTIKKTLKASIAAKACKDHEDVFKVTMYLAEKADVKATVPLACRIALMRYVLQHHSDADFWPVVDKHVTELSDKSEGDAVRIAKLYRAILLKDIKEHGQNDTGKHSLPEDDIACERQQLVSDAMQDEDVEE
ncbi:hypothetical protein PENSPDRAFT_755131 [Peniophora sp. CONT]|nr:hypothetical protein PENSPDRAFT_755131 [Peniophora sp. CONT]